MRIDGVTSQLLACKMMSLQAFQPIVSAHECFAPLTIGCCDTVLGWGLLSQFSPFRYFPHFPLLLKQTLAIEYRVYIWQVSPQLSCGDTCQILMWFRESNRYFCKIEILLTEKLANGALVTPTPEHFSNLQHSIEVVLAEGLRQCHAKLARIILCMYSANERRQYIVTSPFIGWVHMQNNPCVGTVPDDCHFQGN